MSELISDWGPVFTVNEFSDGPRLGVADYGGRPHAYLCEWDDEADDWNEVYLLSPISDEQLRFAEEDWEIYRRYATARHDQKLSPQDKNSALARDQPRHDELKPIISEALVVDRSRSVLAIPEFRGTLEPVHAFEVRWRTA